MLATAAVVVAGLVIVSPFTAYALGDGQSGQTAPAPATSQPTEKKADPVAQQPDKSDSARPLNAVSLSPAVLMTRGLPGQSTTQTLTITNQTTMPFNFELLAQDVAVRDGKRVFVNAGELPHSIAATAVFSKKEVTVTPGQSESVDVTITLAKDTPIRAVVVVFHGTDRLNAQGGSVGMTASLGCLITFTASNNFELSSSAVVIRPQTETRPLKVSLELTNTGTEPVIPEGVAALLTDSGKLVGKVPFGAQRLLPGERLEFAAEYAGQLRPGHYSEVTSFQFEDKTLSKTTEFTIE